MFPPEALERLNRFAAAVDGAAPGVLAGLYVVGSLALGDYRPASSNFDVLAVAERPWGADAVAAARPAVRKLGSPRRPARVGYLTWEDLAAGPDPTRTECVEGGTAVAADELVNPLTWQVMRTAAVCVRGPEYPDLWSGDLRAWAAARLRDHWGPWAERAGTTPGSLLLRRATTPPALEATRLVIALRSGRVVSKLEAGTAEADSGPSRSQRVLKDAVGYRSGSHLSMYWGPFERKNDTLFHVAACVAEARRAGAEPRAPGGER